MFRIVSRQFGYPMYAADAPTGWSDRADEAHEYDHRDNPAFKLKYWRAFADNAGLDASKVEVEPCAS